MQAGREIHRLPECETSVAPPADSNLAGVHADPGPESNPELPIELLVQAGGRHLHVEGGADRAEGVVLVDARDAEHADDGISDELLDCAFVSLDCRAHRGEIATVTVFRCSMGSDRESTAPQLEQNMATASFVLPQLVHSTPEAYGSR